MRKPFDIYLFLLILVTTHYSCKTTSMALKDYSQEDVTYFGFSTRDTVLDYSGHNLFLDNYLFTNNSHMYFYLPCNTTERKAIRHRINKSFPDQFKQSIQLIDDTVLLRSNSVDQIILSKLNLYYKNIDNLLEESTQVLKPTGVLLVSVTTMQSFNLKKYREEKNVISYFENKDFKVLKKKSYIHKKGSYIILMLGKAGFY